MPILFFIVIVVLSTSPDSPELVETREGSRVVALSAPPSESQINDQMGVHRHFSPHPRRNRLIGRESVDDISMHDNWVEQAEAASTMQLRMESIHRSLDLVQVASLDSVDQAEPMFLVMDKPTQWELKVEDERLDKALRRWANEAGYALRWDADRYVLIAASTVFTGSFEKAVEKALDTPGIKYSEYPLEACVYANEPPLIRITRMGDQADICQ